MYKPNWCTLHTVHSRYLAATFLQITHERYPLLPCEVEIWVSFVSSKYGRKFHIRKCCTVCNIVLHCTDIYRESIVFHKHSQKNQGRYPIADLWIWSMGFIFLNSKYDQLFFGVLIESSCYCSRNGNWTFSRVIILFDVVQLQWWFSARLQCLLCISNGDTAVLH